MDFIREDHRVYLLNENNDIIAEVNFPEMSDGTCAITHTFVDPSLRGKGVAAKITEEAYQVLKEKNRKARPVCAYSIKWFEENPEKRDIIA